LKKKFQALEKISKEDDDVVVKREKDVKQVEKTLYPKLPDTAFVSKGETACGDALKSLFGPTHIWQQQYRPDWLLYKFPGRKTPPRNLELDWFCDTLQLAVEYNGSQHYRVEPEFHGTDEALARRRLWGQQQRDLWKAQQCTRNHIRLVVVPYTVATRDIYDFLKSELERGKS
jgi:hypothetical protein